LSAGAAGVKATWWQSTGLAECILTRQVADQKKRDADPADPAFTRLINLLDGSPLALEVVLSNLAALAQAEVAALFAQALGDEGVCKSVPGTAHKLFG